MNKSAIQNNKKNKDDMDCVVIDGSQQNDFVQKTFASTSIGKNVLKLNQCHVTIEECYGEMIASIKLMEEKIKKQTNISMVIQEGVKLFKDNLNKLKAVKSIQVREVHAIETEFKQYISVEAKTAPSKKRVREQSEDENGKQTPLKKSASNKSPKNVALKPKSAALVAKQLSAARATKPHTSPRHTVSPENKTDETVTAVEGNVETRRNIPSLLLQTIRTFKRLLFGGIGERKGKWQRGKKMRKKEGRGE